MRRALVISELRAGRRAIGRWAVLLLLAALATVVSVAWWGERGDAASGLAPIRSVVVLGADRSAAGVLLPVATVLASMAAALHGARQRTSSDENFLLLAGPFAGPLTAAGVRAIVTAVGAGLSVAAGVGAVALGRVLGGIGGSDRIPGVAAWAGLAGGLAVLVGATVIGWAWGWWARLSSGGSLLGWSVAVIVLPSIVAAAVDHPAGEVGGAFLEYALRGGPVICSLSGAWPPWSDAGTHLALTVLGLAPAVLAAAAACWVDRVLIPSPGAPHS